MNERDPCFTTRNISPAVLLRAKCFVTWKGLEKKSSHDDVTTTRKSNHWQLPILIINLYSHDKENPKSMVVLGNVGENPADLAPQLEKIEGKFELKKTKKKKKHMTNENIQKIHIQSRNCELTDKTVNLICTHKGQGNTKSLAISCSIFQDFHPFMIP